MNVSPPYCAQSHGQSYYYRHLDYYLQYFFKTEQTCDEFQGTPGTIGIPMFTTGSEETDVCMYQSGTVSEIIKQYNDKP